jgi:hypothetical protein
VRTLAIILGLAGGALGPVGTGVAFFKIVGALLIGCYGCTSPDGRWLGWGMLVAAAGGLVVAIGVLSSARNAVALGCVELVGAVVLTAAMVLIALDSADMHRYDDGLLAEVAGFAFLYALWGLGALALLGGALAAFQVRFHAAG